MSQVSQWNPIMGLVIISPRNGFVTFVIGVNKFIVLSKKATLDSYKYFQRLDALRGDYGMCVVCRQSSTNIYT